MPLPPPLLIDILKHPERVQRLAIRDWDVLIRQARHANLLGRLHARLAGVEAAIPEPARNHLQAAAHLARRLHHSVLNETAGLRAALDKAGVPLVLLKGAAYVAAGLPAAEGRIFSDIDILVPREALGPAEGRLMQCGWTTPPMTAYDQHYYRRWMHELPPMQHVFRGTILDVHHAILPPTARYHPDPQSILAECTEVPGRPGVHTLSPVDLVLHAATHLFHEGEADNALRDLSDLDLLLRHLSAQGDEFWLGLLQRARAQQLTDPLWLAAHFANRVFELPLPPRAAQELAALAPGPLRRSLLEALYRRIFMPQHPSCTPPGAGLARSALYIRGHWLRMPAHLLTAHLLRKALTPAAVKPRAPLQQN